MTVSCGSMLRRPKVRFRPTFDVRSSSAASTFVFSISSLNYLSIYIKFLKKKFNTEACNDILTALSQPGNAEKLARAREVAGTDMVKVMREVFPIVTQIQLEVSKWMEKSCVLSFFWSQILFDLLKVIQNYGFPGDGDGKFQFLSLLVITVSRSGDGHRKLN